MKQNTTFVVVGRQWKRAPGLQKISNLVDLSYSLHFLLWIEWDLRVEGRINVSVRTVGSKL